MLLTPTSPPVIGPAVQYADPAVTWADQWQAWGSIGALLLALALALVQALRWWSVQRREQADLVSGWLGRDTQGHMAIHVRNGSHAAIHSVGVQVPGDGGSLPWLIIPPETTMTLPSQEENAFTPSPIGFTFTDAGGRGWRRHHDGRLRRAPCYDRVELYGAGRWDRLRRKVRRSTITRN